MHTSHVQLCTELWMRQVQLKGDAKNVVDALNSTNLNESGRGHLTIDIRLALRSIPT